MDTELGTADRIQRFTTVLRKRYVNEAARWFNEQTSCFVKRATIALSDDTAEYDLEASGVISAQDYLWPAKTTASLKRVDASATVTYAEGPGLPYKSEEELNQTRPGWRAESAGVPDCWTFRVDGGSTYLVLVPAPDIPSGDTWTLLWPYVAQPADMSADDDEPYAVSGNPRTTLRPYHRGILHYAAALLERLRKDAVREKKQLDLAAGYVAKYQGDQPRRQQSQRIRVTVDYRRRLRSARPLDPTRWP